MMRRRFDQGESGLPINLPRGDEDVVRPQGHLLVTLQSRGADAFRHQPLADTKAARLRFDQQHAQLGDIVGFPRQEDRADVLAVLLRDPAGFAFAIEIQNECGGDFGDETKNLQYHQVDVFETMVETATASDAEEVLVNKRVRSLAEWKRAVATVDMEIVDLIRVDSDHAIHTPENDLLVLTH